MATTFMVASSVFAEVWRLGIFWLAAFITFVLLSVMIITDRHSHHRFHHLVEKVQGDDPDKGREDYLSCQWIQL